MCCAAQPNSQGEGSPDEIVAAATAEAARELESWGSALVDACKGLDTEGEIAAALDRAAEEIDTERFASLIEKAAVHSAMLGAVDSMLERESDEEEPLPQLASWRETILQKREAPLSRLPFADAIRLFEERRILPRPLFDQLTDAAKRKAFTVAGLAVEELLGDAHAELARQLKESRETTYKDPATGEWVYKGPNLREFDRFARERLERAGWTPANPSHVETIFRTNVMSAYGSGRIVETTQPAVLAARPYWQVVTVGDSRTRPTHKRAHGTILAADHPFWRKAYPPFGYNCRCRVISRSKKWVDAHGGPTRMPDGLPDPGFASGIDASLVPQPLQVPSEGSREPTPGTPVHPIERPLDSIPPPIGVKPPVLPASPPRPTTIAPKGLPIEQGVHAGSFVARVTKRRAAAIVRAYNQDELGWLKRNPIRVFEIERSTFGPGRNTFGSYSPARDKIRVGGTRAKSTFGEELVPGRTGSFSTTRKTEIEACRATAIHELGHRIHVKGSGNVDRVVRAAFREGKPITLRAASDRMEYFAENYAIYRLEPTILENLDPVGYKMVRDVLALWAIPYGAP